MSNLPILLVLFIGGAFALSVNFKALKLDESTELKDPTMKEICDELKQEKDKKDGKHKDLAKKVFSAICTKEATKTDVDQLRKCAKPLWNEAVRTCQNQVNQNQRTCNIYSDELDCIVEEIGASCGGKDAKKFLALLLEWQLVVHTPPATVKMCIQPMLKVLQKFENAKQPALF